jgi:hypothetical protein
MGDTGHNVFNETINNWNNWGQSKIFLCVNFRKGWYRKASIKWIEEVYQQFDVASVLRSKITRFGVRTTAQLFH